LLKSIDLPDRKDTIELGKFLGSKLTAGTVILLEGDLGSGKTTLVQGIADSLGITEPILSPTFTLICEYSEGRIPLYHIDLYRLDSQQVSELALESYWDGVEVELGLMAIEWPKHLPYLPSSPILHVNLLHNQSSRIAILSFTDLTLDL